MLVPKLKLFFYCQMLDTKGLIIHEVFMSESSEELEYTIDKEIAPFGKPLDIIIPSKFTRQ